MCIRFSANKKANETQGMVNLRIKAASVSRHWSSNQISEGSKVTGIIADNQILKTGIRLMLQFIRFS